METKCIQRSRKNLLLIICLVLFFSASQVFAFSDTRFENTVDKGRFGEETSHEFMKARGYEPLKSHHTGEQGLDGVYVKKDPRTREVREIVIVEVKTDSSPHNPEQLSDQTVDRQIDKMSNSKDKEVRETGELLKNNRDKVKKEHHHHDTKKGKTTISEVDAKGNKSAEKATFNTKKVQDKLLEERQKKEGQTANKKSFKNNKKNESKSISKRNKILRRNKSMARRSDMFKLKIRPFPRPSPRPFPRPTPRPFPRPTPRPAPKIPFL